MTAKDFTALINKMKQAKIDLSQLGGLGDQRRPDVVPAKTEDYSKNAALVKKFRDAKCNPEGYILFTYAGAKVWVEAANKAKSTDPAAIAKDLRSGKPAPMAKK